MMRLANLKFEGDGWSYPALPTLVSFGDCWDYNSFLRSIKHLLLNDGTNMDKYDLEMEEHDMNEPILSDVLSHTDVLCIATQLKDEQEIKSLQTLVDVAGKNDVRYTVIILCDTQSRNHEQEQALSRLKGQVNAIIDLTEYNSLPNRQVGDAVSCVVRAIFAAYIFLGHIGIDLEDLRRGIKEHDIAIAAIVNETNASEKILQAATEQISMQHRGLRQAHNVYFAVFGGNENTISPGNLWEILSGVLERGGYVISAIVDSAMKDGEVLVVAIASGFEG